MYSSVGVLLQGAHDVGPARGRDQHRSAVREAVSSDFCGIILLHVKSRISRDSGILAMRRLDWPVCERSGYRGEGEGSRWGIHSDC